MWVALVILLMTGAPIGARNVGYASWEEAREAAAEGFKRGDYERTTAALTAALEIAETFNADDHRLSSTLAYLAGLAAERGRIRDAERYYLRALSALPKESRYDSLRSGIQGGLSTVYYQTGEFSKSERYGQLSLETCESVHGSRSDELAVPLNNLALAYQAEHRFGEAEVALVRALELLDLAGRSNDAVTAHLLNSLGMVRTGMGAPEKGLADVTRAVSIWERTLAADHPRVALGLTNLATLYGRGGHWAEGEEAAVRARNIVTQHFGPMHPSLEPVLRTYANILRHTHRKREAKQLEDEAEKIHEQSRVENVIGYTIEARRLR